MVKNSRGTLSGKTKKLRGKGKFTPAQLVKKFSIGDKVILDPKQYKSGQPHLRYANKNGKIVEKRGIAYVVEIMDGGKKKKIVAHPVHLKTAA